jgi:CTP:molybdopterin cytidylyltransferase MocA
MTCSTTTGQMIKEPPDFESDVTAGDICGVLLAAGAGRRAGGPKALRMDTDGTSWLLRSITTLCDGGCDAVIVVLGCQAICARDLIMASEFAADPMITVVDAPDWQLGMASSLRSGLLAARLQPWRAVLVHLVDLPDVTAEVVRRVIQQTPPGTASLARATYDGRPGHPVCIGRDHLESIMASLAGDAGAKDYLAIHGVHSVECGDLASGKDHDHAGQSRGSDGRRERSEPC